MQEAEVGKLILILGSSGAGKGTVLTALKERHGEYVFPLSCTTRDPRPGEKDGDIYHFVEKDEFKQRIEVGDFLEWAVVHGENYYGTLKQSILKPLLEGKTVIREVDVQGLRSITELVPAVIPEGALKSIFVTVDDWETLKARILGRSDIPDEEIERRRQSFLVESEWADECDVVIENNEGKIKKFVSDVEDAIESMV
jgi:guanylate kinase